MIDTQTKHDGYAVFDEHGEITWASLSPDPMITKSLMCIHRRWDGTEWKEKFEEHGLSTRRVTITEVKDDE